MYDDWIAAVSSKDPLSVLPKIMRRNVFPIVRGGLNIFSWSDVLSVVHAFILCGVHVRGGCARSQFIFWLLLSAGIVLRHVLGSTLVPLLTRLLIIGAIAH